MVSCGCYGNQQPDCGAIALRYDDPDPDLALLSSLLQEFSRSSLREVAFVIEVDDRNRSMSFSLRRGSFDTKYLDFLSKFQQQLKHAVDQVICVSEIQILANELPDCEDFGARSRRLHPRVGAFEVSMFWRNHGAWHQILLFSKIHSKRWPNIGRLVHHITSLLSEAGAQGESSCEAELLNSDIPTSDVLLPQLEDVIPESLDSCTIWQQKNHVMRNCLEMFQTQLEEQRLEVSRRTKESQSKDSLIRKLGMDLRQKTRELHHARKEMELLEGTWASTKASLLAEILSAEQREAHLMQQQPLIRMNSADVRILTSIETQMHTFETQMLVLEEKLKGKNKEWHLRDEGRKLQDRYFACSIGEDRHRLQAHLRNAEVLYADLLNEIEEMSMQNAKSSLSRDLSSANDTNHRARGNSRDSEVEFTAATASSASDKEETLPVFRGDSDAQRINAEFEKGDEGDDTASNMDTILYHFEARSVGDRHVQFEDGALSRTKQRISAVCQSIFSRLRLENDSANAQLKEHADMAQSTSAASESCLQACEAAFHRLSEVLESQNSMRTHSEEAFRSIAREREEMQAENTQLRLQIDHICSALDAGIHQWEHSLEACSGVLERLGCVVEALAQEQERIRRENTRLKDEGVSLLHKLGAAADAAGIRAPQSQLEGISSWLATSAPQWEVCVDRFAETLTRVGQAHAAREASHLAALRARDARISFLEPAVVEAAAAQDGLRARDERISFLESAVADAEAAAAAAAQDVRRQDSDETAAAETVRAQVVAAGRMEELEKAVASLTSARDAWRAELAACEARAQVTGAQLQECRARVEALGAELVTCKEEAAACKEEAAACKEEAAACKEEAAAARAELETYKSAAAAAAAAEAAAVAVALEACKAEVEAGRAELWEKEEEMAAAAAAAAAALEACRAEVEAGRAEVREKEEEMAGRESALQARAARVGDLEQFAEQMRRLQDDALLFRAGGGDSEGSDRDVIGGGSDAPRPRTVGGRLEDVSTGWLREKAQEWGTAGGAAGGGFWSQLAEYAAADSDDRPSRNLVQVAQAAHADGRGDRPGLGGGHGGGGGGGGGMMAAGDSPTGGVPSRRRRSSAAGARTGTGSPSRAALNLNPVEVPARNRLVRPPAAGNVGSSGPPTRNHPSPGDIQSASSSPSSRSAGDSESKLQVGAFDLPVRQSESVMSPGGSVAAAAGDQTRGGPARRRPGRLDKMLRHAQADSDGPQPGGGDASGSYDSD